MNIRILDLWFICQIFDTIEFHFPLIRYLFRDIDKIFFNIRGHGIFHTHDDLSVSAQDYMLFKFSYLL